MTARRTLFFLAIPLSLMLLCFYIWTLSTGVALSGIGRTGAISVTVGAVALLFLSSIAALWDGGRQEAELAQAVRKDPLTGLGNRFQAESRLNLALEQSLINGRAVGVVFCDVNDFKVVNDVYGHTVGDRLLAAIGARFADSVRPSDTVARYGGDEFVVVCPDLRNANDVGLVAERLEMTMDRPFVIGSHSIIAKTSIGITVGYGTRNSAEELLSRADAEMYRNKLQL